MDLSQLTDGEIRSLRTVLENRIKPIEQDISMLRTELNQRFKKQVLEEMRERVRPFVEISKAFFPLSTFLEGNNEICTSRELWLNPETGEYTLTHPNFDDKDRDKWLCRALAWRAFTGTDEEANVACWRKYMAETYAKNPNTFFIISQDEYHLHEYTDYDANGFPIHRSVLLTRLKYAICWKNENSKEAK